MKIQKENRKNKMWQRVHKISYFILSLLLFSLCFTVGACKKQVLVSSIEIVVAPHKTVYEVGEIFDATGMVVKAHYSDKSELLIDNFTCDNMQPLTRNDAFVKIRYEGRAVKQEITVLLKGNNEKYSVSQTLSLADRSLNGKTIYFLGSSVTYGSAALGESMADFIAKRNDCTIIKEAVSGTTLFDNGESSYVQRLKKFDVNCAPDVFICQLSTNDSMSKDKLGSVSQSTQSNDFDKTTTCGAIEYIIDYVKKNWNCKIIFYTNPYFNRPTYKNMVDLLHQISKKWEIAVIDLYNDAEFNAITKEQRELYMDDEIHPTRAGYLEWWTPVFEQKIKEII